MILESTLSCSYLLLTCGACIYNLNKTSHEYYNKLLPEYTFAFVGITATGARSLVVLLYKLFLKAYTFDLDLIEVEEARNKFKYNTLDEVLGTTSTAGFIYSLYYHHGYRILGVLLITSLSLYEILKTQSAEIEIESEGRILRSSAVISEEPKYTALFWVFISGCFAYSVGNNYGLVANYPYLITNWSFPPEGFYQGWTIRRTINDYSMMAYIILMTEALRQTQPL